MIPHDYTERTYGGVLGKLVGVYLGRPFEGWTYDRIMQELGEIHGYVHERLGMPLIVTDDDGTASLVKALDGQHVLASKPYKWHVDQTYQLELAAEGHRLQAWIDGELVFDVQDTHRPLESGAVALICCEGRPATNSVSVRPL